MPLVKIAWKDLEEALEQAEFGLDNPGFCLACGQPAEGCEPDARGYKCEVCDALQVFGAAEVLMMGAYE